MSTTKWGLKAMLVFLGLLPQCLSAQISGYRYPASDFEPYDLTYVLNFDNGYFLAGSSEQPPTSYSNGVYTYTVNTDVGSGYYDFVFEPFGNVHRVCPDPSGTLTWSGIDYSEYNWDADNTSLQMIEPRALCRPNCRVDMCRPPAKVIRLSKFRGGYYTLYFRSGFTGDYRFASLMRVEDEAGRLIYGLDGRGSASAEVLNLIGRDGRQLNILFNNRGRMVSHRPQRFSVQVPNNTLVDLNFSGSLENRRRRTLDARDCALVGPYQVPPVNCP